jgi:predicted ATPase
MVAVGAASRAGPLLERDAELAAMGAAIAGARSGHGGVGLVEGAAGSGKSTLAGATSELAAA